MKNLKPSYKWLNALLFQVGWFCCILGSTEIAIFMTITILCIHFKFINDRAREFRFIIQIALAGFSLDFMLSSIGYIDYLGSSQFPWFMLCLWFLFASTLNWSYKYLVSKTSTALLTGLLAPLSYLAAEKMGKVNYLKSDVECFIVHALIWMSFLCFIHFIEFSKEPLRHA